jgi:hypothetical protein
VKTKTFPIRLLLFPLILAVATSLPAWAQTTDTAVHQHRKVTQVIGGLHSPRGLAFGDDEQLFVAEAGDEGAGSSIIALKDPKSSHPTVRTIVSGLPTAGAEGEFLGIDSALPFGKDEHLVVYALMGLSPHEAGEPFGELLRINDEGHIHRVVNVGRFDFQWTNEHKNLVPDQFPDANPYSVVKVGGHLYVIDAGANTLDQILPDGSVRILAFFPNTPLADAVPTCACEGPDGALYVGTLALVDSVLTGPSAKVFRLNPEDANLAKPWKTPMTVWASGLFPINGCVFDNDGDFYASQLFTNPKHNFNAVFSHPHGDVVKIRFANPGRHIFLTDGALGLAGGVAFHDDTVFVSSGTAHVPPGTGSVVRIDD